MKHKTRIQLFILVAALSAIFLSSHLTKADTTYYWKWSSSQVWKIRAYNTYVKFSSSLYCDKIGYDRFPDNSRWYFSNPQMGSGRWSGWWWITVENGDLTVEKFFESSRFEAKLVGTSVIVRMLCPKPTTIDGARSYTYENNILTLTASSTRLIIDFSPVIPPNPYLEEPAISIYLGVTGLATMLLPIMFICYAIPRGRVSGSTCIALAFVAFVGFALLMAATEM